MLGLKRIVFFLIILFFLVKFFLLPLIRIIRNLSRLIGIKKRLQKFGREIVKIPSRKKLQKASFIYLVVLNLFICVCGILIREPRYFIFLLFNLTALLDLILIKVYSKYNGVYENGILLLDFVTWESIFSWKKIGEDKISFLKQDGLRFDIEVNSNQQKVVDYLVEKGLSEET